MAARLYETQLQLVVQATATCFGTLVEHVRSTLAISVAIKDAAQVLLERVGHSRKVWTVWRTVFGLLAEPVI